MELLTKNKINSYIFLFWNLIKNYSILNILLIMYQLEN